MSQAPIGIPTLTYCRILPNIDSSDIVVESINQVSIDDHIEGKSKYEVAQILDKTLTDEEVCQLSFRKQILNPTRAFVQDAANVVIVFVGSSQSKKHNFLKDVFLPFISSEILTNVSDRSMKLGGFYKAQLSIGSFEIQDESIGDLLRPINRNLIVRNTLESGNMIQGLHSETVVDEYNLRRIILEACDNRGFRANIDHTTGVYEFLLQQSEPTTSSANDASQTTKDYSSRLIVVDLPAIDALISAGSNDVPHHKSLMSFVDVVKLLDNPHRAQLAPYRKSKLTHYLSELIGGNSIVVAMGMLVGNEAKNSKKTMEIISALNNAINYPLGAKEISESMKGLLGKYRSILMNAEDQLQDQSKLLDEQEKRLLAKDEQILALEKEMTNVSNLKKILEDDKKQYMEMNELLKEKCDKLTAEKLEQLKNAIEPAVITDSRPPTAVKKVDEHQKDHKEEPKEREEHDNQVLQRQNASKPMIIEESMKSNEKEESLLQQVTQERDTLTEEKNQLQAQVITLQKQLDVMKEEYGKEKEHLIHEKEEEDHQLKALREQMDEIKDANLNEEDLQQKLYDTTKLLETALQNQLKLEKALSEEKKIVEELSRINAEKQVDSQTPRNNSSIDSYKELEESYQRKERELQEQLQILSEKLAAKDDVLLELRNNIKQLEKSKGVGVGSSSSGGSYQGRNLNNKNDESPRLSHDINVDEDSNIRQGNVNPRENVSNRQRQFIDIIRGNLDVKKEQSYERRYQEIERLLHRKDSDLQQEERLRHQYEKESKEWKKKYREKMKEQFSILTSNTTNTNTNTEEQEMNQIQYQLQSLLTSYHNTEEQHHEQYTLLMNKYQEMIIKYRSLVDQYNISLYHIEDCITVLNDNKFRGDKKIALDVRLKKIIQDKLEEEFIHTQSIVNDCRDELDGMDDTLRDYRRSELKSRSSNTVENTERVSVVIASYQQQLQHSAMKIVQYQQENMQLKIQLEQCIQYQQQLMKKSQDKQYDEKSRRESVTTTTTAATATTNVYLEKMQKTLLDEIQQLKQQLIVNQQSTTNTNTNTNVSDSTATNVIPPGSRKASQQNSPRIIRTNSTTTATATNTTDSESNNFNLIENIIEKVNMITQISSNATSANNSAVNTARKLPVEVTNSSPSTTNSTTVGKDNNRQEQLRNLLLAAEERAAQLAAKQMSLQEELQSYQQYMRDTIPKYQRQIQSLQKQQQHQQQQQQQQPVIQPGEEQNKQIKSVLPEQHQPPTLQKTVNNTTTTSSTSSNNNGTTLSNMKVYEMLAQQSGTRSTVSPRINVIEAHQTKDDTTSKLPSIH